MSRKIKKPTASGVGNDGRTPKPDHKRRTRRIRGRSRGLRVG